MLEVNGRAPGPDLPTAVGSDGLRALRLDHAVEFLARNSRGAVKALIDSRSGVAQFATRRGA